MCDKYQNYINIQSVDNTWLGSNYTLSVKNVKTNLRNNLILLTTKFILHVSEAKTLLGSTNYITSDIIRVTKHHVFSIAAVLVFKLI